MLASVTGPCQVPLGRCWELCGSRLGCRKLARRRAVQQPSAAVAAEPSVAFDRSELQPWLNTPIRSTLPELLPPTVSAMSKAPEAQLVSIITAHGLFSEHAEQAQDGSTVLVLTPMRPQ